MCLCDVLNRPVLTCVLTDVSVHHLGTVFAHCLQVVDLSLQEGHLRFQVFLLQVTHAHTAGEPVREWEEPQRRWMWDKLNESGRKSLIRQGWKAHRLFFAHGLAVGAGTGDVEERLLFVGRGRRRWSADIASSRGGRRRWGSGLAPPTRKAFYAGRIAGRPGALAWGSRGKRTREISEIQLSRDNGPRNRSLYLADILDSGGTLNFDIPKIKSDGQSQRALTIKQPTMLCTTTVYIPYYLECFSSCYYKMYAHFNFPVANCGLPLLVMLRYYMLPKAPFTHPPVASQAEIIQTCKREQGQDISPPQLPW